MGNFLNGLVAPSVASQVNTILHWVKRAAVALTLYKLLRIYLRWKKDISDMKKIGKPYMEEANGIFGSMSALLKNFHRLYDFRVELHEKYGDTFIWQPPIYLPNLLMSTRDPVVVKHILNDQFGRYIKSFIITEGFSDLLGTGIFGVNHGKFADDGGEAWYFQRKTASKIFTKNQFTGHVHEAFINNTKKIMRNIDNYVASGSNEPFLMQRQFFKFTLDTIGVIGFGVDLDTLSKEDVRFSNAFDRAQKHIARRAAARPGWKYLKWLYPAEREVTADVAVLDSFCDKIISDRLLLSEEELSKKGDILSLFLRADKTLSKKYLRDIVMSFFIAGRDTTACTLSFTFLILAQHPEIQEKLYKEIITKSQGVDYITLDDLKQMKYLDGVIRESLRLFPPVPVDAKEAAEDDVLPDGTFIPKGTRISFEVFCMGRDPNRWENPNQPVPERWFEKSPTQYEFPVFQAGPRICLGKDLAVYEAKFATVEILRKYRFELPEALPEPPYTPGITMSVRNGLRLKIYKRDE